MSYKLDRNVTHDGVMYKKWDEIKDKQLLKALERFLVGSEPQEQEEPEQPEEETPQEQEEPKQKTGRKKKGK